MAALWRRLAGCCTAAVLVLGSTAALLGQDYHFGPTAAYVAADDNAAATENDAYRALLQRLNVAEQQIHALTERQAELVPLPPIAGSDAAGNPNVPSVEQRLTAIEQAIGKENGKAPAPPKFPTVRLSGFFHLDAGYFHQDAVNMATLGDIQDGVGFRRARLQAAGSVSEFTNYSIEMDFATAGRPSFFDVWGEQTNLPIFGNVRIGHFRHPFSMTSLTPVRQLWFLERPLPFQAFVPFRRVGIMAYDKSEDDLWSWGYGVYRTGGFNNGPLGDSRYATDIGDNGGYSFSGRLTHLLYYDEPSNGRYLLHVGGGYNYSQITGSASGGNVYRARVFPEFFVGDPTGGGLTVNGTPFFLDTGNIASNQFNLYGVEAAGQYGPVHFQAEYMATQVDQIAGPALFYDGAYIMGGYFLTGEHRTYNHRFGVMDRVTPFTDFFGLGRGSYICGWGAWEATARWSYVNLNDPGGPAPGGPVAPLLRPATPNPGYLNDMAFGVNWYWNAYAKMQFNYIHAFLNDTALGDSNAGIYCARFHVEF